MKEEKDGWTNDSWDHDPEPIPVRNTKKEKNQWDENSWDDFSSGK